MEQLKYFFHKWNISTWPIVFQYFMFTAVMFGIFYIWRRKKVWYARIQQKYPSNKHIKREIFYSFTSLLILGGVLTAMLWLTNKGYTRAYKSISDYGWGYYFFSVFLMVLIHDTYFYWGHRLMHWGPLFKYVHKTHHEFVNPTPFSTYAFHPVEAIFEMSIAFVIIFTIPHHPSAVILFGTYSAVINVLGHMGFEFLPKSFMRNKLLRWHNTPTHHNQHHTNVKTNFGLYFNFWDTIMKTNHKNYFTTFDKLAENRAEHKKHKGEATVAGLNPVITESPEAVSA